MGSFAATAAMTALQMIQAKQQAKAQNAAAAATAQSQIQQNQRAQAIRERQRRERLRQTLASQRARFGARSIGGGGSANAVLQGLTKNTESAIADERSLNAFPINRINTNLELRRQRNLLEASDAQRRSVFNLLSKGYGAFSLLER